MAIDEINKGEQWIDNDRSMNGRVVTILSVKDDRVSYDSGSVISTSNLGRFLKAFRKHNKPLVGIERLSHEIAEREAQHAKEMEGPLHPPVSLLCKLGSIVVHTDEMLSPTGHPYDRPCLRLINTRQPHVITGCTTDAGSNVSSARRSATVSATRRKDAAKVSRHSARLTGFSIGAAEGFMAGEEVNMEDQQKERDRVVSWIRLNMNVRAQEFSELPRRSNDQDVRNSAAYNVLGNTANELHLWAEAMPADYDPATEPAQYVDTVGMPGKFRNNGNPPKLIADVARELAMRAHGDQRCGALPYLTHLGCVVMTLHRFDVASELLVSAAWLHDTLEDTAMTRQEIATAVGEDVAALVEAVTDEPGANRAERKAKTYPKIRKYGVAAVMLKLADRIANVEASASDKPKRRMYQREFPEFSTALYESGECEAMWSHLRELSK